MPPFIPAGEGSQKMVWQGNSGFGDVRWNSEGSALNQKRAEHGLGNFRSTLMVQEVERHSIRILQQHHEFDLQCST